MITKKDSPRPRIAFGLVAVFCLAISPNVQANVVWDWITTDGTSVTSGQLTTDGVLADALLPGNTFNLLSIDSASLNGALITDWNAAGSPPPLTALVIGSIESQGGGAGDFPSAINFITASDGNRIDIGDVGVGTSVASFNSSGGNHYSFVPTATIFTAQVPEPATIALFGIAGLVGLCTLRRRR